MSPSGKHAWRTPVFVFVSSLIIFVIVFGWTSVMPLAAAPLVAGAFVGMSATRPRNAFIAGGGVGLAGAAASVGAHAAGLTRAIVSSGTSTALGGMPSIYSLLSRLGEQGPTAAISSAGTALTVVIGAVGTAASAWAVSAILARRAQDSAAARRGVAFGLMATVCLIYAFSVFGASGEAIANANIEPKRGDYAHDSIIYLKTYYGMLAGKSYYDAFVEGAAGDARIIEQGSVYDNAFHGGWMWGPAAMRRPTVFYVWRYLAPGGGGNVILLAIVASALSLAVIAWGLVPYLAHRAVLVQVIAMPYVLFMTLGRNVFMPDYWGALLSVCSLALVMRRKWVAGAAVLLLAAAVRETAGPSIAIVAATLGAIWLRRGRAREWLARAGAFAAAFVAWLGLERLHEALAARYMPFDYRSSLDVLKESALGRTLAEKVVRPTTFLVPGGFFPLRGVILLLAAPLGFWAALSSAKEVRAVVLAYTLFWVAFLFLVGATSEYWGQTIMLPSIVGVGCLLAVADRIGPRLESAQPIAWA